MGGIASSGVAISDVGARKQNGLQANGVYQVAAPVETPKQRVSTDLSIKATAFDRGYEQLVPQPLQMNANVAMKQVNGYQQQLVPASQIGSAHLTVPARGPQVATSFSQLNVFDLNNQRRVIRGAQQTRVSNDLVLPVHGPDRSTSNISSLNLLLFGN